MSPTLPLHPDTRTGDAVNRAIEHRYADGTRPPDMSEALCLDHDGEMWFPISMTDGDGPSQTAAVAIAICGRCPVKDACLAQAMAHEGGTGTAYRTGIWGGLTPYQRTSLHRRRTRAAAKD